MAKISLRDYLGGIEELIDKGQTDDALAHCRHILTLFPKNIATYRLMGKAYLETHSHAEARDLFQRVLSSCPDDFVSHIGMSIIREEAGDLDGSIWSMERAFEGQPSNRAVQDELRRLYGKREGYAPPKVRLTRGALARMYAHGDLYNQAIGELRSALAEDPQRPDLQILLAEMYEMTRRESEAMEICTSLIEKLPYCLNANRLMVDMLRSGHRDAEAKPYLDRVEEMDPYAAHVDTKTAIDTVPGDIVMLEQLDIRAAETVNPQSLTGSLEAEPTFEKEELPEWLSIETAKEEPVESEVQPENSFPAFVESVEDSETAALEPESLGPEDSDPALSDDQIPEWLRELRPSTRALIDEAQRLGEEVAEAEQEVPAEEVSMETQELTTDKLAAFFAEELATPEGSPVEPMSLKEIPAVNAEEDDLGWLDNLAAKQGTAEEESLTETEHRDSAKPDWMPEQEAEREQDALTWLDEVATESEQPHEQAAETTAPLAEEATPPSGTTPSWLKELSSAAGQEQPVGNGSEDIEPRPLEEAPDWLNELRPGTEELAEGQEDIIEESPVSEPLPRSEDEPEAAAATGSLDWLDELGPPTSPSTPSEWVPESQTNGESELVPPVQAIPMPSARRTASRKAEQEAPGRLEQARQSLNYGKLDDAADHYGFLLRRRLLIKDVIADLDAAVHRHPGNATLWQTLGDAYARNNQLREALDCYKRAEDLL